MTNVQKAREWDKGMNEGGEGYNPYTDAAMADVSVAAEKAFADEWTPAVTAKRRVAWNLFVKSNQTDGKIKVSAVNDQEKKQGWRLVDLKRAVKNHNQ